MAEQVCFDLGNCLIQLLIPCSDIFPDGFAAETLRTLALLFPPHDSRTKKCILSGSRFVKDGSGQVDLEILKCGRVRDRGADQFAYWRRELVALQVIFDKPRQLTLTQSLHDRRNIARWYTFWIAVIVLLLTVFFGVVQSVLSAMQVYKAYYPS